MRQPPKVQLLKADYHRNGVGGLGFRVSLFRDDKHDGDFVGIDFGEDADRETGGIVFAVLNVKALAEGKIEFGYNSWRGDNYASVIRPLTTEVP